MSLSQGILTTLKTKKSIQNSVYNCSDKLGKTQLTYRLILMYFMLYNSNEIYFSTIQVKKCQKQITLRKY